MTLPGSATGSVHVKLTARGSGGASATESGSVAVTAAAPSEPTIVDAQTHEGGDAATPAAALASGR
jgi:hypothetical protein